MCASMGHGYFQSQTGCEEVISAVPYISGFIFRIAVLFRLYTPDGINVAVKTSIQCSSEHAVLRQFDLADMVMRF